MSHSISWRPISPKGTDMRHYEIVVLVGVEQTERGTAMADRYKKVVTDNGGTVHRFEDWGSRWLAYPINKRTRARYFLFNIECNQPILDELRENFRFSESVIRFLITRRDKAITTESPILKEMNEITSEESDLSGDKAETEIKEENKNE